MRCRRRLVSARSRADGLSGTASTKPISKSNDDGNDSCMAGNNRTQKGFGIVAERAERTGIHQCTPLKKQMYEGKTRGHFFTKEL